MCAWQVGSPMPTEVAAKSERSMDIASVRILRLAIGTALSLWFSQVWSWPLSFVAPIITMFLLALPIPALPLKAGLKLVVVLAVCSYAGLLLLPFILNQRLVGVGLLTVALFHSFYFTARGGAPALGAFATIGLAIVASIGTVSIDAVLVVVNGLIVGAVVGVAFVWIAHTILPDSCALATKAAPAPQEKDGPKPDTAIAARRAFRSLLIVLPIIIWFLMSSASASYLAVMIKVSSMGQQATIDETRQAGISLLLSTVIGGIGAIIGWQVLSIWPSLAIYVLFVALAGLIMGRYIFSGPGLAVHGPTWSYGFLTMIIVLAPAVMDGIVGSSAGAAFWSRLWMFVIATVYAMVSVFVFDTLWPSPTARSGGSRE